MIFAVDFDGTIATSNFPEIIGEVPGAIECLKLMKKKDHKIIVWSCRSGKDREDAEEWLKRNNIPFDLFNENLPDRVNAWNNNCRKVFADVYIDDRNFGGVDWNKIKEYLENL